MNNQALKTALSHFIVEVERLSRETHEAEDRLIYEKYMAKAGAILAKVDLDIPVGDDVDSMERFFGHTWLKDDESYSKAYSKWDTFKGLLRRSIHGMTVNERLFNLGLVEEFEDAVSRGDKRHLRKVLFKCFLDEQNIQAIINQQIKAKG
jgi:hypothetical protein